MINENDLVESIQQSLFRWYDFAEDADVYIYDRKNIDVQKGKKFDYIISKTDIESYENPLEFLQLCKNMLKTEGRLIFAFNNRFGIRYFCGDKDLYTHRCFDGIEGYANVSLREGKTFRGRTYSKAEIKRFLNEEGFSNNCFFSVMSDLENPSFIYREDFLPNEDMAIRVFPSYNNPSTIFLEERLLYNGLIENDMFHQMSNAYIVECTLDESVALSDVQHVTNSVDRGKEDAMLTMIHDTGIVEKRALYNEGNERLLRLYENGLRLSGQTVKVISATYQDGRYQMPYVKLENGQKYLKRLMRENKEQFLLALDLFRDTILKSSKVLKNDQDDEDEPILEYGYFDLVPLNSFFDGKEFIFYDQEFCIKNYPANVIIYRMVATLYYNDTNSEKYVPRDELLCRYHLDKKLEKWQKMEGDFLAQLRNEEVLEKYYQCIRANGDAIQYNRKRMERSAEEDRMAYRDIFQDMENKKMFLFGSGKYAERFWTIFGEKYPVEGIIDNKKDKWGNIWHGLTIYSPDVLKDLEEGTYKIMICMADYRDVVCQLDEMKIKNYSVFDVQKLIGNIIAT